MREFARRTGLRENHVEKLIKRLDADPRKDVQMQTLIKIARGAGVTMDWLTMGEGPVEVGDFAALDPYPSRQRAVRAARELDLELEAIREVREEVDEHGAERSAWYWFERIHARHTLIHREPSSAPDPKTPPKMSGRYPKSEKPPATRRSRPH